MTQNSVDSLNPVLQFVSNSTASVITCNNQMADGDAIPTNTLGTEVITLAITPKSATSILTIEFFCCGTFGSASNSAGCALFQDTTSNALAAQNLRYGSSSGGLYYVKHVMTSGTTSSTTFKIRIGQAETNGANRHYAVNGDAAAGRLMGGVSRAWLTIMETKEL